MRETAKKYVVGIIAFFVFLKSFQTIHGHSIYYEDWQAYLEVGLLVAASAACSIGLVLFLYSEKIARWVKYFGLVMIGSFLSIQMMDDDMPLGGKIVIVIGWILFALPYLFAYKAIRMIKKDDEQKAETKQKQDLLDAYGVKGWATKEDLTNRLGFSSPGIYIGNNWHWNEKGHMLTVGGAGSGKGVNLVIPALLSPHLIKSGASVVVLDPKGENAAVCADYLDRNGYDVKIINPTGIKEIMHLGRIRWNPFIEIKPDDVKKMCDMLAYSVHNRTSSGDGSFFDNKCRQYISLYFRYAMHREIYEISEIYDALMLTGEERIKFLGYMVSSKGFSGAKEAENIINSFIGETAKTEENIYSTIREAINIFGDKSVTTFMDAPDDFDTDDYLILEKIPEKPTAVFVCIRHEELRYYAPLIRMFTNCLLKSLTRYYNVDRKVIVLLDEFAQLGYVDEFKNSPAVLRGYNVTLWPIVQELGQLKSIYGDHWETFISNAVVKHWLGGGMDNTTAEYLEKRMPADIKFIGNNPDGSPRERETKLMTASQIMTMNEMIVEIAGLSNPAKFPKIPYYKHEILKENASPNPFY